MTVSSLPLPSPPFPPPVLLRAKRTTGAVLTGWEGPADASHAPSLERRSSLAGNILLIEDHEGQRRKAYLMQRKLRQSVLASIRVGYELVTNSEQDGFWEVATTSSGIYSHEMVEIKVESKSDVFQNEESLIKSNNNSPTISLGSLAVDPLSEFSALQMIAAHDPTGNGHVMGSLLIGCDDSCIYTINPYYHEGSLFDFFSLSGRLAEEEARYFFKQIISGLDTLMQVGLCHRNLTLDNVSLRGTTCIIVNLAYALRIPTDEHGVQHFMETQPPVGTDPQYMAPEIMRNEAFDGTAVDLWSAAVILFKLLVGNDWPFFSAPISEDRIFQEICLRSNLKGCLESYSQGHPEDSEPEGVKLSEEALDLLQRLLTADRKDRIHFDGVKEHRWMSGETRIPVVGPALSENTRSTPTPSC